MKESVRIQLEDFSQDEEIQALQGSSRRMGGIATFLGCARDFSEGRDVREISFDAYGRMALPELKKLRDEAITCFALPDARIVHRLGVVQAGDQIVFIAAGAGTSCAGAGGLSLDDRRTEGASADLEEGNHPHRVRVG